MTHAALMAFGYLLDTVGVGLCVAGLVGWCVLALVAMLARE